MYFPSRKWAVVGVWDWLQTITWRLPPKLLLAGTCGAVWRKAFLTGPGSPEELLETGRRTMSVEPGEQCGGFWAMASSRLWVRRCWNVTSLLQQRAGIHRDDHMAKEEQKDRGDDDPQQWHSGSTWHDHISSPDACICCQPILESSEPYICPHFGFIPSVRKNSQQK